MDFGEGHLPVEIQELACRLAQSEMSIEDDKVPNILTFENNGQQVFGSVKIGDKIEEKFRTKN